jgi:hypothetical protein
MVAGRRGVLVRYPAVQAATKREHAPIRRHLVMEQHVAATRLSNPATLNRATLE